MSEIMETENKTLTLVEVNEILSDTLLQLSKRKITPKRAQSISRTALALSKTIQAAELERRIEFLEATLKHRV